jgi:hypothetical protein
VAATSRSSWTTAPAVQERAKGRRADERLSSSAASDSGCYAASDSLHMPFSTRQAASQLEPEAAYKNQSLPEPRKPGVLSSKADELGVLLRNTTRATAPPLRFARACVRQRKCK